LVDDDDNARLVGFALVPVLSTTTFTTTDVVGPARWQAAEVFVTDEEDDPGGCSSAIFVIEVRYVHCVLHLWSANIFRFL
jgi:hypothetical protein